MSRRQPEEFKKITEHNKRIIADLSRDKLLKIANRVRATFGDLKNGKSKGPESLTDKKLQKFVLALTQSI